MLGLWQPRVDRLSASRSVVLFVMVLTSFPPLALKAPNLISPSVRPVMLSPHWSFIYRREVYKETNQPHFPPLCPSTSSKAVNSIVTCLFKLIFDSEALVPRFQYG